VSAFLEIDLFVIGKPDHANTVAGGLLHWWRRGGP
jgi:hypothetical protein